MVLALDGLHLRHFFALLLFALALNITRWAWAQETTPPPPPGTATIYLINFSMGRSVFVIAPQESHLEHWRRGRNLRPDEQIAWRWGVALPETSTMPQTKWLAGRRINGSIQTLRHLLERGLVFPAWHDATSAVCRIDEHPSVGPPLRAI